MDILRGMLKSKTINVNALVTVLLVTYLQTRGVALDPAVVGSLVALGYGLVNIVLRFTTTKSLPEKGLVVPNPLVIQQTVTAIEENEAALQALYDALVKKAREQRAARGS